MENRLPTNERVEHVRRGGSLCATCFGILKPEGPGQFAHANKLMRHAPVAAKEADAVAWIFRRGPAGAP